MKITLGSLVRSRISNLKGIVICRAEWLHGCVRITYQPEGNKDGKPFEATTVDEPELDVLKAAPDSKPPQPGGDRTIPTRNADPRR